MVVLPQPARVQSARASEPPATSQSLPDGQIRPVPPGQVPPGQVPPGSVPAEPVALTPSADGKSSGVVTPAPFAALLQRLTVGTVSVVDDAGKVLLWRKVGETPPEPTSLRDIISAIGDTTRTVDDVVALWEHLAAGSPVATPAVVAALVAATDRPKSREALWSELSGLSKAFGGKTKTEAHQKSLLATFERERTDILRRLPVVRETEGGGDEMVQLMLHSRVFGGDFNASLAYLMERNPGAVARWIERERGRGRPVTWEQTALDGMMRWKTSHLVGLLTRPQTSLETIDAAGEMFITIFNCLHAMDDRYREQMLRGLGPVEIFNAVISGEQELYRLGTSGYRGFLHPVIMRGIKESGSLETFLQRAAIRGVPGDANALAQRRGMVFLRIASSFGLLDQVLETVRDRDQFVSDAIVALGDPRSFESSSTIVVDVLTARAASPQILAFRKVLLGRLYDSYATATAPAQRGVYGGMLSAYQTVTGDRRDQSIDRAFPLDTSMQSMPFSKVFDADGKGGHVHRIFMRLDEDIDAAQTNVSFRALMRELGASARDERHYTMYRISGRKREIDIYVNAPTDVGIKLGIADIAASLAGKRVHTVVGRGHTGIIAPLQKDSRRLLGDRIKAVSMVIVGTCGGDASVRDLIGTFGYVPFVTTKSTGRQVINNEIMQAYVERLIALTPTETLVMSDVLDRAVAQFLRVRGDEVLREDARLYQVNLTTVLVASLFDVHLKPGTSGYPVAIAARADVLPGQDKPGAQAPLVPLRRLASTGTGGRSGGRQQTDATGPALVGPAVVPDFLTHR